MAVSARAGAFRFAKWGLACLAGWVVLTGSDLRNPIVAGSTIAIAAMMGVALSEPRPRLRLLAALRFIPFFLRESIVGGWDVATRAVKGRAALSPGLVRFRMRLEPGSAPATFLTGVVSLIPGTLCCDVQAGFLLVHVVDLDQDNHGRVRKIEEQVARLFGASLHSQRSAR